MILSCSIRNDFIAELLLIHISSATPMLDTDVGRNGAALGPAYNLSRERS